MACVICDKIKEKKALIVYEDDNLIAILPSKPAAIGHIKIMPKQHFSKLEELSDDLVEELFFLANFSSASVFESLQAQGTNIILNEGNDHLAIDVIPRKENDGLDFMWKPKQLSPEEMDDVFNKVKDSAFTVGKGGDDEKKEEKPVEVQEEKNDVIQIPAEDKTNYLIKQLQRIP